MKKIEAIFLPKIWGWEKWVHSPLPEHQTKTVEGELTTKGPLVKIIKADDNLSIQVHPDDELAQELENQPVGKSECWYILKAKENQDIQVGLKTYNIGEIKKNIDANEWDKFLRYQFIKPGDFIDVPAGVVHGICGGTLLLEIQQPCDITYRFYDYNRKQKDGSLRDLHINKALRSIKKKPWNAKIVNKNPLTFNNEITTLSIFKEPSQVPNDGIVIDLTNDSYPTFYVTKNEQINFSRFAFIQRNW